MQISELMKVTEDNNVEWNYIETKTNNDFIVVRCNSKNILKYGYHTKQQKLYVIFRSSKGTVYTYNNVPIDVFQLMNMAESKGSFLSSAVKKHFKYDKRIDLPPF